MCEGPCVCLACRHEFAHRDEAAVKVFQCPRCELWKAVRQGLYQPPDGTSVQRCHCGCTFFWNIDDGTTMCVECGHWE